MLDLLDHQFSFSAALSSLSGVKGEEFAKSIKFWVLLTWIFQTLGILVDLSGLITNWDGEVFGFGIQWKMPRCYHGLR